MKKETKNWLASAQYDLKTAQALFRTKHHVYAASLCHLAVERALKAPISEATHALPPGSRSLLTLAKMGGVELTGSDSRFMRRLNGAVVATESPHDFRRVARAYPADAAAECLKRTRALVNQMKCHLRQEG